VRWIIIGTDRGRKLENQELLDYYRQHIDADRMERAARNAKAVGAHAISLSSLAAHLYLFEEKHAKTCAKFVKDLIDRRSGGRKLLEKIARLKRQNMGRLHELQTNGLIIQTWNAYRVGTTVTASMLNYDEQKEYPVIA
jgi:hypothetical protein